MLARIFEAMQIEELGRDDIIGAITFVIVICWNLSDPTRYSPCGQDASSIHSHSPISCLEVSRPSSLLAVARSLGNDSVLN
jgi:hypothetical protein